MVLAKGSGGGTSLELHIYIIEAFSSLQFGEAMISLPNASMNFQVIIIDILGYPEVSGRFH